LNEKECERVGSRVLDGISPTKDADFFKSFGHFRVKNKGVDVERERKKKKKFKVKWKNYQIFKSNQRLFFFFLFFFKILTWFF